MCIRDRILRTISNEVFIGNSLVNDHTSRSKYIPRKNKFPYFLLGQIKPVKATDKIANIDVKAQTGKAFHQTKFPVK